MNSGRDFLIALSFANLWFGRLWLTLLSDELVYPRKGSIVPHRMALLLNVLLMAALCWLAMRAVRRSGSARGLKVARFAVLLLLLTSLRPVEMEVPLVEWMGKLALVLIPGMILLLAWACAQRSRAAHATAILLLVLTPFVAVTFGRGIISMLTADPARVADRPAAPPVPPRLEHPKVVWIIFDELDEELAFEVRAPSVALPEFDRLRAQTLAASQAFPPSQSTVSSLPALLTGRLVAQGYFHGPDELLIDFHGADGRAKWSAQPSLFSLARAMGINGAIVGWYHPYCRVLPSHFTSCFWDELMDSTFVLPETLAGRMLFQAATMVEETTRVGNFRLVEFEWVTQRQRKDKRRQHQVLMEQARMALQRPELGLVLIHLSIPHPPAVYDRVTGDYALRTGLSYLDNLVLADRALGELRRALEESGTWERSAVLVTSDHGWRRRTWERRRDWSDEDEQWSHRAGYRVPFLLKMPGQAAPVPYDQPFNTVLTSELLLAVLRGEVRDAEAAAAWLDSHRSFGRSPYIQDP